MRIRKRAVLRASALIAWAVFAVATPLRPGHAELVRVEAIGSVALGAGSTGGATARQEALEAGIRDAVQRTALELARQAGSTADPEAVRAAVGSDARGLTVRYRILEDRGERTPLLESSPGAQREYVVAVEVEVDRGLLRSRLVKAGLLASSSPSSDGGTHRVVLEGVDSYGVWTQIRDALAARGGAVRPVEFAPGRIIAELAAAEAPGSIAGRLAAGLGDAFQVEPRGSEGDALRFGIVRRPLPEDIAPEAAVTPPLEPAGSAPAR